MAKWNDITNPTKWNGIAQIKKINDAGFTYTITITSAVIGEFNWDDTNYYVGWRFYLSSPAPSYANVYVTYMSGGESYLVYFAAGATEVQTSYIYPRYGYNYNPSGSYTSCPAGYAFGDSFHNTTIPAQ